MSSLNDKETEELYTLHGEARAEIVYLNQAIERYEAALLHYARLKPLRAPTHTAEDCACHYCSLYHLLRVLKNKSCNTIRIS